MNVFVADEQRHVQESRRARIRFLLGSLVMILRQGGRQQTYIEHRAYGFLDFFDLAGRHVGALQVLKQADNVAEEESRLGGLRFRD